LILYGLTLGLIEGAIFMHTRRLVVEVKNYSRLLLSLAILTFTLYAIILFLFKKDTSILKKA